MPVDAKEIIFYQEYLGALEKAVKAQTALSKDATLFADQAVRCQQYLNYLEKNNQPIKSSFNMETIKSPSRWFSQQPKVPDRPLLLQCPIPVEQLTTGQSVLFLLASYAELAKKYDPEKFLPAAFDYGFHAMQELGRKVSASSEDKRDQLAADFVALMSDLAGMLPDRLQSGIAIVANSREYEHLMLVSAEVPSDDGAQQGFETFYPVFARVDMAIQEILQTKSTANAVSNDAALRREILTEDDHYQQQNSNAVLQVSQTLSMTVEQEKLNQLFAQLYEQIANDNASVQQAVVNRQSIRFDGSPVSLTDAMLHGMDKVEIDEKRLGLSGRGLPLEERIRGDAILSEVEMLVRQRVEGEMISLIENVSKGDPVAAIRMKNLNGMIANARGYCEEEKVLGVGREMDNTVRFKK